MSVRIDWTSEPFVRREKLNQVLTVTTVVDKNANEATVALVVGSDQVCVWRNLESGIRRSVFIVVFGRNLAFVVLNVFTFNLL
jgi:hypothetical protein